MIVPMLKIRLLGPGPRLTEVLRVVQDAGVLHLTPPPLRLDLHAPESGATTERRQRQLEDLEAETGRTLSALGVTDQVGPATDARPDELPAMARKVGRVRRRVESRAGRRTALDEERALLVRYKDLFSALESLLAARAILPGASAYHVVLRREQAGSLPALRRALREMLGDAFEVLSRTLPSGEIALLLLVPKSEAPRVDRLLAETRVQEVPVPSAYGATLAEAIPRMRQRQASIPAERTALDRELEALRRREGPLLLRARALFRDELARLAALPLSALTSHAFVVEGWVPEAAESRLRDSLHGAFQDTVVVERVSREQWRGEDVPVVLANPRLFRPFEAITRTLPLPRYGTLDPTPFVAVFFPMFFGLMMGDIGYGLAAGLLAWVLTHRAQPGSTRQVIGEMLGACAVFAVLFGIAFGELFGDLGSRLFGLRPLLLNRESALIPFLALAISLGAVHIVLGLILGAMSQRRLHPRQAMGRGLSAVMVLLVIVALLAAFEILPHGFLTPAVIVLLAAFPILVVLEGVVGPIELLSNLGHILSYARIMALGTASVMLAVVANQLAGAVGSVAVGVLFGLLFHLVNFGLGLFSPAIHALRLHYVEFFGTFYSPGGTRYQPLGHWSPDAGHPA